MLEEQAAKYEQIMEVIASRRSIRSFKPDPIPDEHVGKVLEAAQWAPSGANAQPWDFIVIKDPHRIWDVAAIFEKEHRRRRRVASDFPGGSMSYLRLAPVIILVCGDPRFKVCYPKDRSKALKEVIFAGSIAAAVQNLHLAAAALGLGGSTWINIGEPAERALKHLLGIPPALRVLYCCPLGYPARRSRTRWRRPLESMVHREAFETHKMRTEEEIEQFLEERARILWSDKGPRLAPDNMTGGPP